MNERQSSTRLSEPAPRPGNAAGSSMGMAGLSPGISERWADDAFHPQRTPGAYEWWYFDAVDGAGNGVVVILFHGLPFYTPYQNQVARWHRRLGQSVVDPPWPQVQAGYYPAAYMGVYQGGQRVAQFLNLYPPGSFEGSTEMPEIRVGPNRVTMRADGSFGIVARGYPFEVRGGAPVARRNQTLSATLNFAPTTAGVQHVRAFRPAGPDGALHRWVLAAPHGTMTGRVQHIAEQESVALLDMAIESQGYHDHNFGQGAVGLGLKRLGWGHLVGEDWTIAWQRTVPKGKGTVRTDGLLLFEQGQPPMVIEAPAIETAQRRTTKWLLRYPGRVAMHGSDAHGNSVELLLHHEAVIEASPFHARLSAAATLTVMGKRRYAGRGVTNVMMLQRLWWPLLSDLVLKAVLPIASDDPLWRQ